MHEQKWITFNNYSIVSPLRFKIMYCSRDNSLKEQNSIKKNWQYLQPNKKSPKPKMKHKSHLHCPEKFMWSALSKRSIQNDSFFFPPFRKISKKALLLKLVTLLPSCSYELFLTHLFLQLFILKPESKYLKWLLRHTHTKKGIFHSFSTAIETKENYNYTAWISPLKREAHTVFKLAFLKCCLSSMCTEGVRIYDICLLTNTM